MKPWRSKKDEDIEAKVEEFIQETSTPPPSARLLDYGLQRVLEKAAGDEAAKYGELKGRSIYRNPSMMRHALLIMTAVLLILVLSTTGVYAMSYNALPGSTLYGTKIFFERVRLAINLSPTEDAQMEIEFSRRRMEELQEMVASGRSKGADRWLREYQRNLRGAQEILRAVPEDEAEELAREWKGSLQKQAALMEKLQDKASPELAEEVKEAQEVCEEEKEQVQQRGQNQPGQPPTMQDGDGNKPDAENTDPGHGGRP
jgi:hypothetical protein